MSSEDAVQDHDKQPFHFVRALLVTMPLAILVGSVVAPPDPFSQLFLIAATLVGGVAVTYRWVRTRRYGPKQLAAFFGVVFLGTLLGLWLFGTIGAGPLPDIVARLAIVLASFGVADILVFRHRA